MTVNQVHRIYCDESCHMQHDGADIMVLGALTCSAETAIAITKHIKWLRHEHGYTPELKWSKLHKHQWPLYKALIDLFIQQDELLFKATIVKHKKRLDHEAYNANSHNTFYYKMLYYTLRDFLKPDVEYRIYLDYMDTLGSEKSKKLVEILQPKCPKISATIIHSYESQMIQFSDLLIGAVAYRNRTDIVCGSTIKRQFAEYLEEQLGYSLKSNTPPWERKFNLFQFTPRNTDHA